MKDYLNIGCSPAGEKCAAVGKMDYPHQAHKECRALINMLRRINGPEPSGAALRVKSFPHDFGQYYEVVCYYDETNKETIDYAFKCEDLPENWDNEARKELGI